MTWPALLLLLSLPMQPPVPALPFPQLFPVPQLFQFAEYETEEEQAVIKPTVQILYGDDPRSKLLVSELTRDWTRTKRPVRVDSWLLLQRLNGVRDGLQPHLTLVDAQRDPVLKYRTDLPLWRIREYGEPQKFDPRTFGTTSWPLLTVKSLVFEATVDLAEWKRACRWQEQGAKTDYFNEISAWVSLIAPRDIAEFSRKHCEDNDEGFTQFTSDTLVAEYGSWDGFPVFQWEPPPRPRHPLPWEPDFMLPALPAIPIP